MKKVKPISVLLIIVFLVSIVSTTPISGVQGNPADEVKIYVTKLNTKESMVQLPSVYLNDLSSSINDSYISIYSWDKKQKLIGIGGAMTESAVYAINSLPADKQTEIYDAYFGEAGSKYSLIRTHVGSCDFSLSQYSYCDTPNNVPDPQLNNFSIYADRSDLIPAIKRALSYNSDIKIFAAPWAPPGWMKASGLRIGKGFPGSINAGSISTTPNHMKPEYFSAYAEYLTRYLQQYKAEGVPIWSLSLQNESQNNPTWECCYWPINETITFIADHLGPALAQKNLSDVKLLIWDWDKAEGKIGRGDGIITYTSSVLNSRAAPYVYGTGMHWYDFNLNDTISGRPTWATEESFQTVQNLNSLFPNNHLIATEGCDTGPALNSIQPARRYIYDIINDFKVGTEGWIDWNMVLDSNGGPLHDNPNPCHAPIMVNTQTKEIIYNPAYYVLKHLSRAARPGTVVLGSSSNIVSDKDKGLHHVSILNEQTGEITLLVGNITNADQSFNLVEGGRSVKLIAQAQSLTSYVFNKSSEYSNALATNKPSFSSSSEKNISEGLLSPGRAFDLNLTSRWGSAFKNNTEWIYVDLQQEKNVFGAEFLWSWGWKNKYCIQLSLDGINWTTALTVPAITQQNTNLPYDEKRNVLGFAPQQARYVRMQGLENKMGYGYSICDFKVFTR